MVLVDDVELGVLLLALLERVGRGSVDVNAIDWPSGDQANAPTDSSADVSFIASPPPRSMR